MTHRLLCIAALAAVIATPTWAVTKTIELPPDGTQLKPSSLPGYEKAQANCVACHSAEYMLYQPATAARATFKPKSALPQVRCSPVHRTRGEGCGERWCKCVEASAGAAWNTVLFP